MTKFKLETTDELIGSNSGIVLAGAILTGEDFKNQINLSLGHQTKFSVDHFTDYEIIKSYIGLLCLGKMSFESIDQFHSDEIFKHSLDLVKLPSKETLRQRIEKISAKLNSGLRIFTSSFIDRFADLEFISDTDYVPIDFDVTPFDNSNSSKEGVTWTYKKFMGFAPMMTYIGGTGYMLNNEFREGSAHSNCAGTAEFVKQCLDLAQEISIDEKYLLRFDSGNVY